MANEIKTQLKTNLQNVKAQGRTRVARIRDILKAAASETIAEVKQGSGEIRTIATDAFSTVVDTLDNGEVKSASEASGANRSPSKPLLAKMFGAIKTQLSNQFKRQAVKLDGELGQRYGDRYQAGKQRLHQVAGQVAERYQQEVATAKAQGSTPLQQTQVRMHDKASVFGTAIAQREQQIKQRLKALLQTTVTKG